MITLRSAWIYVFLAAIVFPVANLLWVGWPWPVIWAVLGGMVWLAMSLTIDVWWDRRKSPSHDLNAGRRP